MQLLTRESERRGEEPGRREDDRERGSGRHAHAAAWSVGSATIIYLLLEFGLIGPDARKGAVEAERRLARVEAQYEALGPRMTRLEGAVDAMRSDVLREVRGLRESLRD